MSSVVLRWAQRLGQCGPQGVLRLAADRVGARLECRRELRHGPQNFSVNGVEHVQLVQLHNRTWRNERAVEVPLAVAFLDGCVGPTLELGNVLANYGRRGHVVVDKYEARPGVVNVDVDDYRPRERFVAISTLEHVGLGRRAARPGQDPSGSPAPALPAPALGPDARHLPSLLQPSLDTMITAGTLGADRQSFLVRGQGLWTEASPAAAFAQAQMGPAGGNAIWMAELSP